MHVEYLPFEPRRATVPDWPGETPVGRVRVRPDIGMEMRDAYILATRPFANRQISLRVTWPYPWPTAIAQRMNDTEIIQAWMQKRKFLLWARQTFNIWE